MFSSELAYDDFMGRFSTRLAPLFAAFAAIADGQRVLDVGAGTGALTSELVRRGADVAAAEPSADFAAVLERRYPGVEVRQAAAESLPWPDGRFDAALAQLVVSFMADAAAGIGEMRRVVRTGGVVAACMWDLAGMELLAAVHRVQQALAPDRVTQEASRRYRRRDELEELFGGDAAIELLEVQAPYAGFEDFWSALQGGAGPAGAWLQSLDDERRAEAREVMLEQLGRPGGPFSLTGRAWAAKVRRA
jgi:SAM-dependent methyltransferase